MRLEEFTADDIVDYLNQELPGFEPSLIRDTKTQSVTMRVRAALRFGAYAQMGDEFLMFPLPGRGYDLQRHVDEFIRKTRQDMIDKLGLQKEIDKQVQQMLQRERRDIEANAYRKAMDDALVRVAREAREAEDERARRMWNAFMGRDVDPAVD
jgi:hypothetical protein